MTASNNKNKDVFYEKNCFYDVYTSFYSFSLYNSGGSFNQRYHIGFPVVNVNAVVGFDKVPNAAQYKNADWSQALGIAKGVTLEQAVKIANETYPQSTFFFYTNAYQMVLETERGDYRVFHTGDTVYFTGSPWWGSAPGMADGYIRQVPAS